VIICFHPEDISMDGFDSRFSRPKSREVIFKAKAKAIGLLDQGQSSNLQVVTTLTSDCLQTGRPSWYTSNTKVNSAFHPSGVGKSSTNLSLGVKARHAHLRRVAANTE